MCGVQTTLSSASSGSPRLVSGSSSYTSTAAIAGQPLRSAATSAPRSINPARLVLTSNAPYCPTARPSLSRRSFVVIKEPAKSVATANTPTGLPHRVAVDEHMAQPLMISLVAIMGHELGQGAAEVTLPDRDDSIQALFFDRSHKALRMRVRVRRAHRRAHRADSGVGQQLANAPAPFPIPVADQHTTREAKSMTNTVSYVTKPRHVHTSVVKKSAPAIAPQCAFKNVCHEVGRWGAGGSAPAFQTCA